MHVTAHGGFLGRRSPGFLTHMNQRKRKASHRHSSALPQKLLISLGVQQHMVKHVPRQHAIKQLTPMPQGWVSFFDISSISISRRQVHTIVSIDTARSNYQHRSMPPAQTISIDRYHTQTIDSVPFYTIDSPNQNNRWYRGCNRNRMGL